MPSVESISLVYALALGRDPSPDEIEHWSLAVGGGLPFENFLDEVAKGEEARTFRAREHSTPKVEADAAIESVYQHALDRHPSAQERAHWTSALGQYLSFADFMTEVATSEEAQAVSRRKTIVQESRPNAGTDDGAIRTAINAIYEQALGRVPLPVEADHWSASMNQGLAFKDFVSEVEASEEAWTFQQRRDDPPPRAPDARNRRTDHAKTTAAIAFVYESAFGREPSPDEYGLWSNAFDGGLAFEDFVSEVTESPEARSRAKLRGGVGGVAEPGSNGAPDTATRATAIAFVYRHALRREPEAEDLATWAAHLAAGIPFERFLLDLLSSEEARLLPRADPDEPSEAAIAFVYRGALRREATPGDIARWTRHLAAGLPFQRFVLDLLSSEEARLLPRADPDEPSEAAIAFVYRHALRREPKAEDLATWTRHLAAGLPFQRFVLDLLSSEEARLLPHADPDEPSEAAIAFVYRHALRREATPEDVARWTRHLATGLPFQRFVLDLLSSEEARLLPHADPDEPSEAAIAFVYRHALRREPKAEDLAAWTRHLAAGLPFQRFVLDLLSSEEARLLPRADPDEPSEAAIAFVYRHALRREATPEDVAKWSRHLAAGLPFQRFVLDLLSSEEARLLPQADPNEPSEAAITFVYRSALRREPTPEDFAIWSKHLRAGLPFQRFVLDIAGSEEAAMQTSSSVGAEELPDGLFVAHLYEFFLGRCALAGEILEWKRRLARHSYPRADLLLSFFGAAVRDERERQVAAWRHDPTSITMMGTDRRLDTDVWTKRVASLAGGTEEPFRPAPMARPYVVRPNTVKVTAIASLYKGGQFIEKFLSNITAQSMGENFELVIIDANSPDNEYEVIRKYAKRFPNIRYERMNYRIGIYDAWNVAVDIARGEYLTNTNLDDLRRRDSLQIQTETLERVALADVVYQDFFYSFDADLSFSDVEALGFVSAVPIVTRNNILEHNSPHNAPMWRKRLHREVGLFDTSLKSAGDHDFWLRCLQADKVFYKINTPHVVYYQNPTGVSTRPGTPGVDEGMRILKKHGRKLISPFVYMDTTRFSAELGATGGIPSIDADPLYPETAVRQEILALLDAQGREGPRARRP